MTSRRLDFLLWLQLRTSVLCKMLWPQLYFLVQVTSLLPLLVEYWSLAAQSSSSSTRHSPNYLVTMHCTVLITVRDISMHVRCEERATSLMLPPVLIVLLVSATLCGVVAVIYACLYYTRINPKASAARRQLRAAGRGKTCHVTVTSTTGATTTTTTTTNAAGNDADQSPVITSQLPMTATHLFLFRKTSWLSTYLVSMNTTILCLAYATAEFHLSADVGRLYSRLYSRSTTR